MDRKKTGTKEWAETTENIQLGCPHGCRYCYAQYDAVKWHKWCTAEQWLVPVIVCWKVHRSFLKRLGVIMFPSTHDITKRNISECIHVLRTMLEAGNKVLVVSKPHYNCIKEICLDFTKYRRQLSFRLTIGSMDPAVLSFWEPNAPCFEERFQSLKYARECGYQTSISCEPFLDSDLNKIINLYETLKPLVTNSFWIGKLRKFDRRVELLDVPYSDVRRFVHPLKAAQIDDSIWIIVEQLRNEKLIRWKDSIVEALERGSGKKIIPGFKPIDLGTAWGTPEGGLP